MRWRRPTIAKLAEGIYQRTGQMASGSCGYVSRALTASPSGSLTARSGPIGMRGRAGRRCAASRDRRNSSRPTMKPSLTKVAPPSGVLLALLFRFQDSAEFQFGISARTTSRLHQADKAHRTRLRRFSDQGAQTIQRATIGVSRMARSAGDKRRCDRPTMLTALWRAVLSWAHNRGLIAKNPCANGRQAVSRHPRQ